jgi:hypothetical protein
MNLYCANCRRPIRCLMPAETWIHTAIGGEPGRDRRDCSDLTAPAFAVPGPTLIARPATDLAMEYGRLMGAVNYAVILGLAGLEGMT